LDFTLFQLIFFIKFGCCFAKANLPTNFIKKKLSCCFAKANLPTNFIKKKLKKKIYIGSIIKAIKVRNDIKLPRGLHPKMLAGMDLSLSKRISTTPPSGREKSKTKSGIRNDLKLSVKRERPLRGLHGLRVSYRLAN
jgi:hypothetical protein